MSIEKIDFISCQIELGDCTGAPVTIFKTLSDLGRLERIRLEKGTVTDNVGKLARGDRYRGIYYIFYRDLKIFPGLFGFCFASLFGSFSSLLSFFILLFSLFPLFRWIHD